MVCVPISGWFQKLLKFRALPAKEQEQESKKTKNFTTPSKPLQSQSALSSVQRWSRRYDMFVCHSCMDSDSVEAGRLVSFLEASPLSLRCFLRQRDDCPGGAISTELCEAVQNSHLWVLLITPDFLQDEWCKYMMHQALAEGPMSNRIIPLIQNLSRSDYPQELRFYCYIDLSRNPDRSYTLLSNTVLKCEYVHWVAILKHLLCLFCVTYHVSHWYPIRWTK